MSKKVFLGGTCNNSSWRDYLIPKLQIDYFNPVVKDWKPEDQQKEIQERANADIVLYVITGLMTGVYSIAEVVEDSIKQPQKTVFAYVLDGADGAFTKHQAKSLKQVGQMVYHNGAKTIELKDFSELDKLAELLNNMV